MPRCYRKHFKFSTHVLFIFSFSYFVTLRDVKIIDYHQLDRYSPDLRHILIWTELPGVVHDGQRHFIDNRCENMNCYFFKNRSFFEDIRYFDAIVFNLQQISLGAEDLPPLRGLNQKYIFAANDSSDNFPVCDPGYDSFFNWTWSYRRDSTIPYKFFAISTLDNQWLDRDINFRSNMEALTAFQKSQMKSKFKAAATFLDHCESRSRREELIDALEVALNQYNLSIDVYGDCGSLKCRRNTLTPCYYRLKKNYYFFLALEDSLATDYITDVVLHAYRNDVVPVVYGGAKYREFLPPNSFLDVQKFHNVSLLAQKMHSLIKVKPAYYEYFRWKNHYSFHKGSVLDLCSLCDYLNKPSMLMKSYTYKDFRKWWNVMYESRCSG